MDQFHTFSKLCVFCPFEYPVFKFLTHLSVNLAFSCYKWYFQWTSIPNFDLFPVNNSFLVKTTLTTLKSWSFSPEIPWRRLLFVFYLIIFVSPIWNWFQCNHRHPQTLPSVPWGQDHKGETLLEGVEVTSEQPLLPREAPWGLLSPRFQNQSHGLQGWGWLWVLCAAEGGCPWWVSGQGPSNYICIVRLRQQPWPSARTF